MKNIGDQDGGVVRALDYESTSLSSRPGHRKG